MGGDPLHGLNGNGIRVPRWLVTVVVATAAVLGTGYAMGQRAGADSTQMQAVELRLCRIERALHIDPWPTCPRERAP